MFTFFSLLGYSQEFKNEEERKKHADKLFDKGKYVEASPHILHFLSLNQTSPEYNFKYGVCLMYSDEDKEKSLRYLKFSASKGGGGDNRVYFFLGKSYHLNYNFKAAIVNYNKFKAKGAENYKKDLQVDLHLKMCSNGTKLLQNLTELVVYDKIESSFERFQYSYDLKEIGGKILVSAEFQSKYDKKIGYKSVVYFPPLNQDILFYSSYGKDGSTGLDLYIVRRSATGGWGKPEKLPATINTPYDDAYGFLHADGKTFYFSSKGHSSMGGYDVFKVNYDIQINQFGTPENLDYKINTPDDDIMYIVDPNFENAYFSSSRAAKGGYLDVYKVKVETFPIVNVILAGSFENKINPEDNAATIKVENMQSGEIEGIYNPDKLGNYIIVLPRSGKYKFIVETPESEKIHTGIVDVPSQKVIKPLKQSLALVMEGGTEKLVINNLFDEEVTNAAEIMAKVLKSMSDPEPNADDFPDSLFTQLDIDIDIVTEALDENYSIDDLTSMSADKAKEVQEEATELKKRMEAAYTVANNKSNEAKEITKQANGLLTEIETIANPLEKQEKIALAKKAHNQSKDLNMLATTALNLANSLKKEYDKKQAEADNANNVAIAIEKAVNENSHDKAIAALKDLQSRIDNLIDDKPDHTSGYDVIVQKSKLKQEEADKANIEAQEYREADTELNLRLNSLKREYEKAKKKDQESIQRQIDDIKEQLELNDEFAKESFAKSASLQEEADVLSHQVDLMTNLYDDIDSGTTVELTEEEKQQVKDYLASNELAETISKNEANLNQHVDGSSNFSTNPDETNISNSETEGTDEIALTAEEKENAVTNIKEEFTNYETELNALINEDESTLLTSKQTVTENWIASLDEKIGVITNQLAESTDEMTKLELEEQLNWLSSEKTSKETDIAAYEEAITALDNNEPTETEVINELTLTAIEKENAVTNIQEEFTNYETELNALTNEDESTLLVSKKAITENWVTSLGEKIAVITTQLAETTDEKEKLELEEQLNWLVSEKSGKEASLATYENELAVLNNNSVEENNSNEESSPEVTLTEEEKETIISNTEEIYTSFEDELSAIDPNTPEAELVASKKKITEDWIKALDDEIMDVEDQLALETDQQNKANGEAKLNWLTEKKSEKEIDLNFLEEAIAAIDSTENNNLTTETENEVVLTETEKESIVTIQKEKYNAFEERLLNVAKNEDESESLLKKSEITEEWISNLDGEINTTETQLANTTIPKEKLTLQTQLDWLTEENARRKEELASYTSDIASLEENVTIIDEGQIEEENQKATDWLSIIDNDINELDNKINAENDPIKKAELIASKEKLVQLKNEKQNIVETNTTIIEKSSEQKAIENTLDYKELVQQIENTSSIPTDFESSFTTDLEYKSDEAKNREEKNSSKIEELIVLEQEKSDLEAELASTNKEKKQVAIQSKIDSKNDEIAGSEVELGEEINTINELEYKSNEIQIKELVANLKSDNKEVIKDENYQTAKLLEEKYIAQNKEANDLLTEASFTENEIKKAEKLKEVHSIQQAALENQQEALAVLKEMEASDYESTILGEEVDLFADDNEKELEVLNSTYISSQETKFSNLESELESLPIEEKETFLADWKSQVSFEFNKNMKLLTSDISDEDKEVVNGNVQWLRSQQELVNSKIEENNALAVNNIIDETETNNTEEETGSNIIDENTSSNPEVENNTNTVESTVNNELENNTVEENETNPVTNNTGEESGSNLTEETPTTNTEEENNTNNEENNTTTELENNVVEENGTNSETNNTEEQTPATNTEEENSIESLSIQKEVFNELENELKAANSSEEKISVYEELISKIDSEIVTNEKEIEGNITVDEEAVIQTKLDWLKDQKEEKAQLLASVTEENILANNSESNTETTNNTVSESIKQNSKIKETVEGIDFYSANEELEVVEVSTTVEKKEITQQTEFKSSAATTIIEDNQSTINKVKGYATVINTLEEQKSTSDNEKFKAGVDKKITKTTIKKEKTELKLADDFKEATANDNELVNEKLAEVKSLITESTDQESYTYKQALEYENKSEQLENEASQLRNEAAGVKSVIEKNDKITEALSKEKTSIAYKEKASKLYADAIVNSSSIDEVNITTVSEDPAERTSTQLFSAATTADNLAYEYSTRAGELRDSANTVKKKNKAKVIQEAEVYTQRAAIQKSLADELNKEGSRIENKEAEVLENDLFVTNLSQNDVEKVRTADNYDKIYAKQLAIEQFLKELRAEEELMRSYENLAKQQENKALAYKERAKNTSSEKEKEEYNSIAEKLLTQANENRKKLDYQVEVVASLNDKKDVIEQEQFDLLALFTEDMQNDIKGLMLSNYDKTPLEAKEEVIVVAPTSLELNNLTSSAFEAPEELTANIVIIDNNQESVYSDANPIPLNPKNPNGLVYKVQVGAFRKPIPQNLFKGFAPISAEKINDDITRYRVGYFVNFGTANVSKNQIRQLGYKDAFVVAILNGKRISISEARAYAENPNTDILAVNENGTNPSETNSTPDNNANSETNNTIEEASTNTANENNTTDEDTTGEESSSTTEEVPDYVQNLGEDAAAVNAVENIKGLFYTVQVGAFSNPIAKTGTFNISPLVTKYVNGLYKYTTGIYKSVRDAADRKNEVRAKGIPDAFVIAYYNGEKISIAKASQIIQEQGNTAFANKAEGSNVEVIEAPKVVEDKNTYYVDLGVYWGSVPRVIAEALLSNKAAKIKRNKISDAATQYYCGVFLSKEEVTKVWNSFVEGGITDANIVKIREDQVFILMEKEDAMIKETEEKQNRAKEKIEEKLIYRVELGTYNETIPATIGQVFLELSYLGIEKKSYNNQQAYYCGKVDSEEQANELKQKFVEKGITEAKIVAFKGDRQISLIEAAELAK